MPAPLPERKADEHAPPPTLPPEQRMGGPALNELRQEVSELLGRSGSRGFPGSQPVSFAKKHLQDLQDRDYYVCEKSDGIRCMMYLTAEADGAGGGPPTETAYLIDRRNDYYQVRGLHFPRSVDDPAAFHTRTVLDGELVNDREADGSVQLRFLVFDCLVCDNQLLTERRLDKRLAYFQQFVYAPYRELFWKMYPDERQHQPFLVELKKMELSYGTEMMFRQTLQNLKHGNDGLIFTCRVTPYQHGTDPNTLKWKPSDINSIDFKLELDVPTYYPSDDEEPFPDYDAVPKLNISVKGNSDNDIPWGEMSVTEAEWDKLKAHEEPLDERIVECFLDENQRWRFMRFRDDKKNANHISTVESVIDSIKEPVSQEDLVEIAPAVRKNWKIRNEPAK